MTRPRSLDLLERVERELALIVDRDHRELGAGPLRDVLPRDEVRVVLELRRDGDIAGAEVVEPPGVRDQVESLGAVPGEDHLACRTALIERESFSRAPS